MIIRPVPTVRWLWAHGGLLLIMVPFGYHWLPQGAALRAMSGVAFGFGLVAFLRLTLPERSPGRSAHGSIGNSFRMGWYMAGFVATMLLVPWLGSFGNVGMAEVLAVFTACGALVLYGLVAVNIFMLLRATAQALQNLTGCCRRERS